MSFNPPTLVESLDNSNYRAQLNSNFTLISRAFTNIANDLRRVISSKSFASNLSGIEPILRPSGIIGRDSFQPGFNTDGDTFQITHSASMGFSSCVISSLFHCTSTTYTKALADLCSADGTYELVFGVETKTAPLCEQKLVLDSTDEDEIDLPIWRFLVTRSGGAFVASDLRLACNMVLSRESFADVHDLAHPLALAVPGSLASVAGPVGIGFIVPWDCEVAGASFRIGSGPTSTDGVEFDVLTGEEGTDAVSVLASTAAFSPGEAGTVVEVAEASSPAQLRAGTYAYPYVTVPGSGVEDLSVTLLLRKLPHPIW
jgi:hypothetical protein